MPTRHYRFAGSFYPLAKGDILEFIDDSVSKADVNAKDVGSALAYQVPHAGYEYSGYTAAYAYKALMMNKSLNAIDTVVLIGPNHTGYGMPIAVSAMDWETPLGIAKNDIELSNAIAESAGIDLDDAAHAGEHSLEVQLPFLQHLLAGTGRAKKYVFVCMGDQSIGASTLLFDSIQKALKGVKRNIIVIASSDLNHYESAEAANRKDSELLKAMKSMDPVKFNKLIDELNISACGFGPITVAMMHSKSMGASNGLILKYSNSGDRTGDYSSVVEYSAVAFM